MLRNLLMTGLTSLVGAVFVLSQPLLLPQQEAAAPNRRLAADQPAAGRSSDSQQSGPSRRDAGLALFREQIRPLLIGKCVECHRPERKEGGLDLTRTKTALAEGDTGRAIVPGEPDQSLAYQLVTAFEMPPDLEKLLSPEQTAALKRWIELGAPYDGRPLSVAGAQESDSGAAEAEAMMCPCMKMMEAKRQTNAVALSEPLSKDEAAERAEHYLNSLGNPNLKIGQVNETAISYETQVLTTDGSLVNWIIVDKKTGQLNTLY